MNWSLVVLVGRCASFDSCVDRSLCRLIAGVDFLMSLGSVGRSLTVGRSL